MTKVASNVGVQSAQQREGAVRKSTALTLTTEEQTLVDSLSLEKAGRILSRSLGDDLKVERFLKGEFNLPKRLIDVETVNKVLSTIEAGSGYGNPRGNAVVLKAITAPKIAEQVAKKTEEFAKMVLNDEQREKIAAKMAAYEAHLERYVNCEAVAILKRTFGAE